MTPILLLIIYAALSAWTAWLTDLCLRKWRFTEGRAVRLRRFWLIPFALLSLLPVAGAFLPDSPVKFALQAAGNVWLGFYLYYGLALVVLTLAARIARLARRRRGAGRGYGVLLCASLVLSLALSGYGLVHAQNTVVTRCALTLDKPGQDKRIVLLGDLHLGVNSRLSTTQRMVELVNAEQPDVVLVAGDIFTSSYAGLSHPDQYAEALRGIRAREGVYAVFGNHDMEETLFGGFPISPISQAFRSAEMERFMDDCGFVTLTDDLTALEGGVQLAGRIDLDKSGDGTSDHMTPDQLLAGADRSRPILVLQHEPREFGALREAGADIAFCGHTHAGQVFPGNLIVPLFNENAWGYERVGGLDTFVTAGVGYYGPPMRIGTNSEIMVIDLRFESEGANP